MKNIPDNEKRIDEMSENELDARLRFDAFMGGVKDGGLRSTSSISLMVSYLIANLGGKITAEIISNAMVEGELANYFEVNNAIGALIKNGTVKENADKTLELVSRSTEEIDLIEKDLPYTVRVMGIKLCQKILAKEKYRRENKTEIIDNGDHFTVELHVSGGSTDFMKLSLFVPTVEQAEMIREKFLSNPSRVYENLINSIFENEE